MADRLIAQKEHELDRLKIDEEIAETRSSIAEKKAVERAAKKKYGRDWRKVLGFTKGFMPSGETVHRLYSLDPELRELAKPQMRRYR